MQVTILSLPNLSSFSRPKLNLVPPKSSPRNPNHHVKELPAKRISVSFDTLLASNRLGHGKFEARSAASIQDETSSEDKEASRAGVASALQLSAMFGVWYGLNIYFNIFNKQVLRVFPFPASVTAFQFGCGTLAILTMWAFNLHPRPKLTRSQLAAILPLVLAHTVGNLLTNISLGKVAVSFTHTIKAMEPFFTVLFASLFLGEKPSVPVISSLVPIVGGVVLASCTEASFNWIGFLTAMASNVTNQSRNVLSKKFMNNEEETIDNINLFSVMTVLSFLLLVPTALTLEGFKFGPSYLNHAASQGLNIRELMFRCVLSGFCFHSYQQVRNFPATLRIIFWVGNPLEQYIATYLTVSYMILSMVNAVTHAVGNSVKRVVVIVSSVLFFHTAVAPINSIGTATALAGVFLYSRAKRIKPAVDLNEA